MATAAVSGMAKWILRTTSQTLHMRRTSYKFAAEFPLLSSRSLQDSIFQQVYQFPHWGTVGTVPRGVLKVWEPQNKQSSLAT